MTLQTFKATIAMIVFPHLPQEEHARFLGCAIALVRFVHDYPPAIALTRGNALLLPWNLELEHTTEWTLSGILSDCHVPVSLQLPRWK